MNSAGAVPRPNAIMMSAPFTASSCRVAMSSTEYTNPQGIQPHTMPNAKPRGSVLMGNMLSVLFVPLGLALALR